MRIWRDIPAADQLRASGIKERSFLEAVKQYHLVRKDSLQNLFPRIAKLLEVIRVGKKSGGMLSSPSAGIKKVMSRATSKIEYLRILHDYYTLQHPDEIANPSALAQKLDSEQETADGGKLIGLMAHNKLEKLDPLHRPWENNRLDGALNTDGDWTPYVANWLGEITEGYDEPFFVYLENTRHCLDRDAAKNIEVVRYHTYRPEVKGEMPVWWVYNEGGALRQWHPVSKTNKTFDTSWVTRKDTSKGGNFHGLAFVWTAQKELVADLHNPVKDEGRHRFHHSSFTGGALVRCAGMIAAVQGKVTYLDNNSGHYNPPRDNLKRLVKHLNKRDLFARDAKVSCHGDIDRPVADFLAR